MHPRWGRLRTVRFTYQKQMPGDTGPATFAVEVPLLSLVPIPMLQVKEAEFDFAVQILDSAQFGSDTSLADPSVAPTDAGKFLSGDRVQLKAVVARKQSLDLKMNVKLRVEQAYMPAGLTKVIHLMDQSVTANQIVTKGKEL